jgi:phosphinothricin acetyltransferase
MADYRVTPMTAEHAQAVLVIYQEGADTGDAIFDDEAPDWAPFDADHLPEHRFVATDATGQVLGWIAAAAVSARRGYAGVIESSEKAGIWTLECGVFPENTASLALHARAGFRVVGTRERLGRHHHRWRDVILLERRSPRVGQ